MSSLNDIKLHSDEEFGSVLVFFMVYAPLETGSGLKILKRSAHVVTVAASDPGVVRMLCPHDLCVSGNIPIGDLMFKIIDGTTIGSVHGWAPDILNEWKSSEMLLQFEIDTMTLVPVCTLDKMQGVVSI